MLKKMFIILLSIFYWSSLYAVTAAQLRQWQNQGVMLVGIGEAETATEADKLALQDLASQIVVNVKSQFELVARDQGHSVEEYCESFVQTFSDIQFSNAQKYIVPNSADGKTIIYRYMRPEDKEKIFAERKTQILGLIAEAEMAEEMQQCADAIRNYYWALLLLKAHPDYNSMTYFLKGKDRLLKTTLIQKVETILSAIDLTVVQSSPSGNCMDFVLEAHYQQKPADGLRLRYHDGYGWSSFERWSNGKGFISLQQNVAETIDFLQLEIDCSFADHGFSGEIRQAIATIQHPQMSHARKQCAWQKAAVVNISEEKPTLVVAANTTASNKVDILNEVVDAVFNKDLGTARRYFTAGGFRDFNALIGYGQAEIFPVETEISMMQWGDLCVLRSVPMKFSFRSSPEGFTEKVNFIFNADNQIEGITFALSDAAVQDIMERDTSYASKEEKALIINFMEQYKTAYCLKDLDFIEQVFSEDALIIVGRVVEKASNEYPNRMYQQLGDEMVEYIRLKKGEYIDRLQNQFARKEFINIRFADNKLDRVSAANQRIFGIQIAQYYYSSTYSDKGYLFLMFDFQDPDAPQIMVRSWQPQKAEDGSIIGLDHFQFE